MVEKKVEIEGVGLSRRDPRRNSVQDAGPDVENGGMATHLVTKRCDLGSVGVPAPARTPLGFKPGCPGAAIFPHHQAGVKKHVCTHPLKLLRFFLIIRHVLDLCVTVWPNIFHPHQISSCIV